MTGPNRLQRDLARTADRIAQARIVAKAIIDGRQAMSLLDKLDLVVTRREDLNKYLDVSADHVLQRYAALGTKAERAFDKHHARLAAEEAAIDKTDAAIERMSNAAGNSRGSEKSEPPPKGANGADASAMITSARNEGATG